MVQELTRTFTTCLDLTSANPGKQAAEANRQARKVLVLAVAAASVVLALLVGH